MGFAIRHQIYIMFVCHIEPLGDSIFYPEYIFLTKMQTYN
jgi:hypothetical protein